MANRNNIINHLYQKKELVNGFDFDSLTHPPISAYLTEEDIIQLNRLALSARLNAKPKEKYKAMDDVMRRRGFTRLHAGTNRLVYKSEYDDTFVMKVGIDKVGITDNPSEFYNQQALKPFCCKIFDVTPCGTVAMVERVDAIRNRQQFEEIADNVFHTIVYRFRGFLMEDIGSNFFMNWGVRKGFGPVILDYPYTYKADMHKMKCTHVDKDTGIECDGLIDYDIGFNTLVCEKCGTRYTARELGKHNHVISIESTLKNYKGGENFMEKFVVGTVIDGKQYWFEDGGDRVIKPIERQKADKKFDESIKKRKTKTILEPKSAKKPRNISEILAPGELEKLKEQLAKAKETKKEEEVKPVEEKKEEVPVIAKADEPIEPSPKMVTTEVPDTPISAKARMQRANIVARTAQLEDEWLEANGMNYNEDQCLTAANDCIEYITPIIHEEFGIDAISANTLVSEVVRDNFRDDYSSDETSDEPVSDGCSKKETTSNNDGEDNVAEGNKKQSDRPKVVENNRLAEF